MVKIYVSNVDKCFKIAKQYLQRKQTGIDAGSTLDFSTTSAKDWIDFGRAIKGLQQHIYAEDERIPPMIDAVLEILEAQYGIDSLDAYWYLILPAMGYPDVGKPPQSELLQEPQLLPDLVKTTLPASSSDRYPPLKPGASTDSFETIELWNCSISIEQDNLAGKLYLSCNGRMFKSYPIEEIAVARSDWTHITASLEYEVIGGYVSLESNPQLGVQDFFPGR